MYLLTERGPAAATEGSHKLLSLRFLREVCPAGTDGFAALTPETVIDYVERHALDGSADSGKVMRGVVRAFLRYLHLKGFISTVLADCVRRWRLTGLPTFLPPEKVQKVLDACDRTTALGHRDYAVLMILAKLGLRASEVATLNLDDIDWQCGTSLVHGKGRRQATMPLRHDVGTAIVAYPPPVAPKRAGGPDRKGSMQMQDCFFVTLLSD